MSKILKKIENKNSKTLPGSSRAGDPGGLLGDLLAAAELFELELGGLEALQGALATVHAALGAHLHTINQ